MRMEDDHPLELIGPVSLPSTPEIAALVIRGLFLDSERIVCLVIRSHPAEIERMSKNAADLFGMVLTQAVTTWSNWQDIPAFIAAGEYAGADDQHYEQLRLFTWRKPAADLHQLALDVLADTRRVFDRKIGDQLHRFTQSPDEADSGFQTVQVTRLDSLVSYSMMVNDPADLNLLDEVTPVLNEMHAQAYFAEVLSGLKQESDPLVTFRSAFYLMQLDSVFRDEHLEDVLKLAQVLFQALRKREMDDYADWVAAKSAELAEDAGLYEQAVQALRLGGIVNESIGRMSETRRYYERALALLDRIQDERLKAQVHMSLGISLIVLLTHWESETTRPQAWDRQLKEVLPLAQHHLSLARQTFAQLSDASNTQWAMASIDLDLLRLTDLSGDPLATVQGITTLVESNPQLQEPRLYLTAIMYQLAALQKLARADAGWRGSFYELLNNAEKIFSQNASGLRERSIVFYTFMGDALAENAQHLQAVQAYQIAHQLQLSYQSRAARPPQPNEDYGGVLVIDLCGKIQSALLQVEKAGAPPGEQLPPSLYAFFLAEDARNRFLKRDLTLLNLPLDQSHSSYLHERQRNLHLLMARGQGKVDPRIQMADYEWFLKSSLGKDGLQALEQINRFNDLLTPNEIEQILAQSGPNTALLSFYQSNNQAFLYLITRPDTPPTVFSLPISLDELDRASRLLVQGIEGVPNVLPPILADQPELRQRYFAAFEQIGQHFQPVIQLLEGIENIIISPHGLWHSLPIHAILLPPLWQRGSIPALSYTPSLRLMTLLQERSQQRFEHYRMRALTTAYRPADVEAGSLSLFQQAHESLMAQLAEVEHPLRAAYGEESTKERFFSDTQLVDLHHILAHGNFEGQQDPLQSSIWLADGPLSALVLLSEGTQARHVTLQACSIGRVRPGFGDEFWGFSRALLAAGADSLVAPMWHVILGPSTRLLNQFYENWLVQGQAKGRAWGSALHQFYQQSQNTPYQHFFHWAAFRMVGI